MITKEQARGAKKIQIRLHSNQENGGFFIYEKCTSCAYAALET